MIYEFNGRFGRALIVGATIILHGRFLLIQDFGCEGAGESRDLFVTNSRQRKKQKRAQQLASRERLWFIAEHPLLASGAGAMAAIGVGAELSGAPKLAALCYLAALGLLIIVFIRADLFRVAPKKAWII